MMDTKRLEEIKQKRERMLDMWGEDVCENFVADDVNQLIAEVERLHTENKNLVQALDEIAEMVSERGSPLMRAQVSKICKSAGVW